MLKNMGLAAIAAALLLASPVTVLTSDVAAARTCMTEFITAWGKRKNTMFGARVSARYAWKATSRRVYGTKFDTWWPSRMQSMKCFTNRAGTKRCRARARPCTIL